MNFIALCVFFFTCGVANAHAPWSDIHSPIHFGKSSYSFPSYDTHSSHIRAKYYAKKAHDLAKLRSSIYGIGHGLYGFRYGSFFPKHFSKPFPLMPFMKKYPIFDHGLHYYPFWSSSHSPFFFDTPHHFSSISEPLDLFGYPKSYSISEPLIGFGYPKSYHSSYSHSYSYGKGHSSGHKYAQEYGKPHGYGYSSINVPYVKKKIPGGAIFYKSGHGPNSQGYEYAYVKETPEHSKFIPSPGLGGYSSIYGLKHNDFEPIDSKFPAHSLEYESEIPLKQGDYVFIPSSDIALVGEPHEVDSYIPMHESSFEKVGDATPDADLHALSIHSRPQLHKFEDSDFIGYGSEKSESKAFKEK